MNFEMQSGRRFIKVFQLAKRLRIEQDFAMQRFLEGFRVFDIRMAFAQKPGDFLQRLIMVLPKLLRHFEVIGVLDV
jgi:hypothetical protein